jgi:rhamnulose-1-phosphate aldolase
MIDLYHPHLSEILDKIREVAGLIHSYGWAEANAGNLSIDVSDILGDLCPPQKRAFIVSRSGSRYRQTAVSPHDNLLLILSDNDQDSFLPTSAKPTSEWISHRCLQMANPSKKVILHTHPAEIIALNNDELLSDKAELNKYFRRILPEMSIYLPAGIAICPLHPPGSDALCQASMNAISDEDALIWSGHGLLTFAASLDQALDYQEIIVKAAKIHFLMKER